MAQSSTDIAGSLARYVLGGGGLLAILFTIRQLATQHRAHMLEIYRQVFRILDDIRSERHYVQNMHRQALLADEAKEKAEKVFRSFDQLGFLVREGRIPVDIVARSYARPILMAWYQLAPYVIHVRREREQPGHGWEWQNLVYNIVVKGLRANFGVWKGVLQHDNLGTWVECCESVRSEAEDSGGRYELGEYLWYSRSWPSKLWHRFFRSIESIQAEIYHQAEAMDKGSR
ncbi:MAG: hypothetical protein HYR60_11120 [Acidobacteria bacterium]|nr:hypothetical protein [Acidobacteriota bacterium]